MQKILILPKKSKHFIFPIPDGTAKLFGRDYEIRESTLRQYHLVGSQDLRQELQENSDGSHDQHEHKMTLKSRLG